MSPQQIFEASKLIEAQISATGAKDYVNADVSREDDAILRSKRFIEQSHLLGRAALIQLDKPFSQNTACAKWLYVVSYRDVKSPSQLADAGITLFPEGAIMSIKDSAVAGDPEAFLEDLRSLNQTV